MTQGQGQASGDADLLQGEFDTPRVELSDQEDQGLFVSVEVLEKEKAKILTAMGVIGILIGFDQTIMDVVQENRSEILTTLADIGDFTGSKHFLPQFLLGTMGVGLVFKNEKLKRASWRAIKTAVVSGLVTEMLKSFTHRKRPNKGEGPYVFEGPHWTSGNTSFPSGHSTAAWAVATVFATEFSEHKYVPWIAYSLAAVTSWSRVYDEKHWASDVVLGALIGYVTGKLFTKTLFKKDSRVTLLPTLGKSVGVMAFVKLGKKPTKKDDYLFESQW